MRNQRQLTGCNKGYIIRNEADVRSDRNGLIGELRRGTFDSYSKTRQNVCQSSLEVSRCFKKMFGAGAIGLQQGVLDALCGGVGDVQWLSIMGSDVVD